MVQLIPKSSVKGGMYRWLHENGTTRPFGIFPLFIVIFAKLEGNHCDEASFGLVAVSLV